jgi:FAD/FMN-containing dehydrogenase
VSIVTEPTHPENAQTADLVEGLRAAVRGSVDDSSRRRAEYSTDASNYRVVPQVVVFPRDTDDVLAALDVARAAGVPVTSRGGGTSVAGNAIGTGVVIDLSRHVNRVLEIDPEARTARVEPGVILTDLQKAAAPHGLRFGPDPSTQARATLGGMIGNNACGPRAVAYGRTADNVVDLDVIDGLGRRFTAGRGLDPVPGLDALVRATMETLRTELGRFGRQVSGYSLEHLLPENGADLAKALVGTEGTVVTVLGATVNLVPVPAAPVLVVLGYPDMASAADVVPALLAHAPLAIEGIDARLVDVVRRAQGASAVPTLPAGGGWLMVEVGGTTLDEALDRAHALAADAGTDAVGIFPPGPDAAAMWRIRADGAGLAGRTASGAQAWPGFEDSAVPPARLGTYLRELEALMASHGVDGLAYGHFGDGCVHLRLDIPLERSGNPLREFMTDAAHLVAAHGGSSGPGRSMRTCAARTRTRCRPRRAGLRSRTTRATSPRPCTAASGSASAARTPRRPTGSCARRTSRRATRRTPRAAEPACCRRWRTGRSSREGGRRPRCTRPSTCAWAARRARATAQRASTWLSTSPRCCTVHTAVGCALSGTTCSAGCPAGSDS